MTREGWELLGAMLLVGPAIYSFLRLCRARVTEWRAAREPDPNTRLLLTEDARRLAGSSSLFPGWLLGLLGLGLAIQAGTLLVRAFF